MKTKKFFMTSLLVMGMIIAKAANGFPPELVLVSQPVLTYNANSVTIYYDVQNIGDYTYRGNLYIYLDPDDGRCYAEEYMKVCPGRIKRVAVTIPAYRPNPSWVYTVMPYYELYDELFSFTMFEYFEPVSFCWYGYRNEPWVVFRVGPRVRSYTRLGEYRFYYDGYRPMLPPPPPGHGPDHGHNHAPSLGFSHDMPPMDPHHHTYSYHHSNGGYPANHTVERPTPGYNTPSEAAVARPTYSNTAGSSSTRASAPTSTSAPTPNVSASSRDNGSSSSSSTRPSGTSTSSSSSSRGSSSSSTRPSGTSTSSSTGSSSSTRPSGTSTSSTGSSSSTRPSGTSTSSTGSSSSTRPSGTSTSSTGSSSSTRPSGTSTSSTGSSSSTRPSGTSTSSTGSSSSTRPSGTSTSSSSSSRGSSSSSTSSSSSSRSGNASGSSSSTRGGSSSSRSSSSSSSSRSGSSSSSSSRR